MIDPFNSSDLTLNAVADDFAERTETDIDFVCTSLPDGRGWLVSTVSPNGNVIGKGSAAELATAIVRAATRTLKAIDEVEAQIDALMAGEDEDE